MVSPAAGRTVVVNSKSTLWLLLNTKWPRMDHAVSTHTTINGAYGYYEMVSSTPGMWVPRYVV
jgi:hypothetical protein